MTVVVVPYRPEWVQQFEEEANKLRGIFQKELIDIHHIGSTSVPGLPAKPITGGDAPPSYAITWRCVHSPDKTAR